VRPMLLVYAICTCCRIARLVPITYRAARGERFMCIYCDHATERWLAREMAKK
jgi:hypothetical protein